MGDVLSEYPYARSKTYPLQRDRKLSAALDRTVGTCPGQKYRTQQDRPENQRESFTAIGEGYWFNSLAVV